MLMKRSIGVVITSEAITALVCDMALTGKRAFSLKQVPLPDGCISELSGAVVDISSLQESVERLLPRVAKWSFADTLIYLVLPERLFDHSSMEIPEKFSGLRERELLASGILKLAANSDANVHGICIDAKGSSKTRRALLVTAREARIQDYLSIFRREDRFIARVVSPEIACYQFWRLLRQEVISKRAILCSAREKLARFEVWDQGILIDQWDLSSDLAEQDLNRSYGATLDISSLHTERLIAKVSEIVNQYRERGEPIHEVLLGGGAPVSSAISAALSDEHGIEIISSRSRESILQEQLPRFIISEHSCPSEEAIGAAYPAFCNTKSIWRRFGHDKFNT